MKVYGGVDIQFHVILTSALDGGVWSTSRPYLFTQYPLDRLLGWPQIQYGRRRENKNLAGAGNRILIARPFSEYTFSIPTELTQLIKCYGYKILCEHVLHTTVIINNKIVKENAKHIMAYATFLIRVE
jgi:hypothetical protein